MNGILLVNKPRGWTSMDVCAKLRSAFHEKRVGHSGTLDPMATGLLVVFLGRATRAVSFAEADSKTYVASLRLGIETDTQDVTGTVLRETEPNVTREQLEAVLTRFRGEIEQIPPMYSALKVHGQKLCDLARKGREVQRQPRPVTIHSLEIRGVEDNGDYFLEVSCSKGTYIRTLCHDIGAALGCGGAMSELHRTRAGAFSVGQAYGLDEVLSAAAEGRGADLLLPLDSLFSDRERMELSPAQEKVIRNGGRFTCGAAEDRQYRLYGRDGAFLALGEVHEGQMRAVKSFYEV